MGAARCTGVAGDLFDLNDEGVAEVLLPEVPLEMQEDARHAMDACPVGAISIEE